MKSIRSFIICISTTMYGGAVSVTDGRLVSCRSCLLGALLLLGPSWSLLARPYGCWVLRSFGVVAPLGRGFAW